MGTKQVRQKGYSKVLYQRLKEEHPEIAQRITEDEALILVEFAWGIVGELLKDGYRIIFEGYFSFFTKPIKRKCTNLHTGETWWSYKRRIRVKAAPDIKQLAEVEISEQEYTEAIQLETKK